MATDDERDRLEACRDDLTVARRVHRHARERAMRLKLELLSALRAVERIERALEGVASVDVQKQLRRTRKRLESAAAGGWPGGLRVDGSVADASSLKPEFLRYRGTWRPPGPPASPQELGCTAVVCGCLEELRNAAQVRQHWETGCFDWPEYETDREMEDLIKELDPDDQCE